MNTYPIGNTVTMTAQFGVPAPTALDLDAVTPASPTDVKVIVSDPNQNITTYAFSAGQVTQTGPGAYALSVVVQTAGTWSYRFEGTGAVVAASDASFNVLYSDLAGIA
jgi:hypothetical protein